MFKTQFTGIISCEIPFKEFYMKNTSYIILYHKNINTEVLHFILNSFIFQHVISVHFPLNASVLLTYNTILFQNQCFFHKKIISSMGTPLVSGKKKYTKMVIIVIQPAKKRNIPNLKVHNRERKDWPIMNVKKRFTATVMLCPADRISNGNISLGTVQPRGPHDHPNAVTNRQITTTTSIEKLLESSLSLPNSSPSITATIT